MNHDVPTPLVSSIKERCRVGSTCGRESPAKAIRIFAGPAEVIPQRRRAQGSSLTALRNPGAAP